MSNRSSSSTSNEEQGHLGPGGATDPFLYDDDDDDDDVNLLPLPGQQQTWIHAVGDVETWKSAIFDDKLAIETDLVMGQKRRRQHDSSQNHCCVDAADDAGGTTTSSSSTTRNIPIMAHPPSTVSDLTMDLAFDIFEQWLVSKVLTKSTGTTRTTAPTRTRSRTKIIKLDFKDQETIVPTLRRIRDVQEHILQQQLLLQEEESLKVQQPEEEESGGGGCGGVQVHAQQQKVFFVLNADILCGPGRRDSSCLTIDKDYFLNTCLREIKNIQQQRKKEDKALRWKQLKTTNNEESCRSSSSNSGNNISFSKFGFEFGFGLSLGYKTNYQDETDRYTRNDLHEMERLLLRLDRRHQRQKKSNSNSNEENEYDGSENDCDSPSAEPPPVGIILALNARILSRQVDVFDPFLLLPRVEIESPPTTIQQEQRQQQDEEQQRKIDCIQHHHHRRRRQLLLWTGKGEPPIPKSTIDNIQNHYRQNGLIDHVGFDCHVCELGMTE